MFFDEVAMDEAIEMGIALCYTFDAFDRVSTLQMAALKRVSMLERTSTAVNDFIRGADLPVTILSRTVHLYGQKYLKTTLNPVLKKILAKRRNLEIHSVQPDDIQKDVDNLLAGVKAVLNAIWESVESIPL
jgi:hypothetical protein